MYAGVPVRRRRRRRLKTLIGDLKVFEDKRWGGRYSANTKICFCILLAHLSELGTIYLASS